MAAIFDRPEPIRGFMRGSAAACHRNCHRTPLDVYFFLPDPNVGCQPAVAPFWLGAAAMVLIFSFFGFFDSRLLLAMTFSLCLS
jgi:hypothetical protein